MNFEALDVVDFRIASTLIESAGVAVPARIESILEALVQGWQVTVATAGRGGTVSDMEPNGRRREKNRTTREKRPRRLQLSVPASVLVCTKKVFREVRSGYAHVRHLNGFYNMIAET